MGIHCGRCGGGGGTFIQSPAQIFYNDTLTLTQDGEAPYEFDVYELQGDTLDEQIIFDDEGLTLLTSSQFEVSQSSPSKNIYLSTNTSVLPVVALLRFYSDNILIGEARTDNAMTEFSGCFTLQFPEMPVKNFKVTFTQQNTEADIGSSVFFFCLRTNFPL